MQHVVPQPTLGLPFSALRSQFSARLFLVSLVSSFQVGSSQGYFRNAVLVNSEDMSEPPEPSMFNFIAPHYDSLSFYIGPHWRSFLAKRCNVSSRHPLWNALIFFMSLSTTLQHSEPYSKTDLTLLLHSQILVLRLYCFGLQMFWRRENVLWALLSLKLMSLLHALSLHKEAFQGT